MGNSVLAYFLAAGGGGALSVIVSAIITIIRAPTQIRSEATAAKDAQRRADYEISSTALELSRLVTADAQQMVDRATAELRAAREELLAARQSYGAEVADLRAQITRLWDYIDDPSLPIPERPPWARKAAR